MLDLKAAKKSKAAQQQHEQDPPPPPRTIFKHAALPESQRTSAGLRSERNDPSGIFVPTHPRLYPSRIPTKSRKAWDRDVAGGEWEDLKLEWVGSPSGLDGSLHGDERGRVIILSRPLNAYVSWNGSRFTHVSNREGATVFMFQRVATGPA